MARHARELSDRSRFAWGLACIALGCYPISIALGLLPADQARLTSPLWVVAAAGIVFVIAGFMILLANHSRINDLLAGVLCLLFAIMGMWVALFSSSEGFSGGLPLLSDEQNVALGRWVFGLGSLLSLAIAAYAFRRAAQSSR